VSFQKSSARSARPEKKRTLCHAVMMLHSNANAATRVPTAKKNKKFDKDFKTSIVSRPVQNDERIR